MARYVEDLDVFAQNVYEVLRGARISLQMNLQAFLLFHHVFDLSQLVFPADLWENSKLRVLARIVVLHCEW